MGRGSVVVGENVTFVLSSKEWLAMEQWKEDGKGTYLLHRAGDLGAGAELLAVCRCRGRGGSVLVQ